MSFLGIAGQNNSESFTDASGAVLPGRRGMPRRRGVTENSPYFSLFKRTVAFIGVQKFRILCWLRITTLQIIKMSKKMEKNAKFQLCSANFVQRAPPAVYAHWRVTIARKTAVMVHFKGLLVPGDGEDRNLAFFSRNGGKGVIQNQETLVRIADIRHTVDIFLMPRDAECSLLCVGHV